MRGEPQSPCPPARAWLELDDARLLAQCAVDLYRASGPGGQKRNKTSSAVRLRHRPSGVAVIATESRSQHENRRRALRRLRRAIALTQRNRVAPDGPLPSFFTEALACDPALGISRRHGDYWRIVQYVLDVMLGHKASVADTARCLGLSTGHLVGFLRRDGKLWAQANELRGGFGRRPLR